MSDCKPFPKWNPLPARSQNEQGVDSNPAPPITSKSNSSYSAALFLGSPTRIASIIARTPNVLSQPQRTHQAIPAPSLSDAFALAARMSLRAVQKSRSLNSVFAHRCKNPTHCTKNGPKYAQLNLISPKSSPYEFNDWRFCTQGACGSFNKWRFCTARDVFENKEEYNRRVTSKTSLRTARKELL